MRSSDDDLTTKARIRDAAIRLFGRDGFEVVSVRAIAERAGVSAALVIHHFGSKQGLRKACDDFVVQELFAIDHQLVVSAADVMRAWLADIEQFRPLIDYLARVLADRSPAADRVFDALLAGTAQMLDEQIVAGVMREPIDRQVTAAYLTVYGIVPLVLQRQLARALGGDQLDTALLRRSTLPILDLYTNGLYTDDRLLRAATEALREGQEP